MEYIQIISILLILLGSALLIVERIEKIFKNIEYRERKDGTVYRLDGKPIWWNK